MRTIEEILADFATKFEGDNGAAFVALADEVRERYNADLDEARSRAEAASAELVRRYKAELLGLEPERKDTTDEIIEPDGSTSTKEVEEDYPDTTKVTYTAEDLLS